MKGTGAGNGEEKMGEESRKRWMMGDQPSSFPCNHRRCNACTYTSSLGCIQRLQLFSWWDKGWWAFWCFWCGLFYIAEIKRGLGNHFSTFSLSLLGPGCSLLQISFPFRSVYTRPSQLPEQGHAQTGRKTSYSTWGTYNPTAWTLDSPISINTTPTPFSFLSTQLFFF